MYGRDAHDILIPPNISNNSTKKKKKKGKKENAKRNLSTIYYAVAVKFTCVNNKDVENKRKQKKKYYPL